MKEYTVKVMMPEGEYCNGCDLLDVGNEELEPMCWAKKERITVIGRYYKKPPNCPTKDAATLSAEQKREGGDEPAEGMSEVLAEAALEKKA